MNDLTSNPVLIVSMGVSGCGKSTLAQYLAQEFDFCFLEADDFHSEQNKAHMAAGKALTDTMREPWIASMCKSLEDKRQTGKSCVLAYSGLRRSHRQKFRELGYSTMFFHLTGPKSLIRERMQARTGHFMPAELLDSQYKALEDTKSEADILEIDLAKSIPQIMEQTKLLTEQFIHNRLTITSKQPR